MGQVTRILALFLVGLVGGSILPHSQTSGNLNKGVRQSKQLGDKLGAGVDFTGCVTNPENGFCCIEKTESVTSLKKEPILECTHKNTEQCHYTYVTQFKPSQEEVCDETFEKLCSITFKQQAYNETVNKCYRPVEKVCNGQGEEVCQTAVKKTTQQIRFKKLVFLNFILVGRK